MSLYTTVNEKGNVVHLEEGFNPPTGRKKWRMGKAFLKGALIGVVLASLGRGFIESENYDKLKTSYLANQGTAHVRLYDADGLESIVITNNTSTNPELTQIPSQGLHNLYSDRFIFELSNLKKGHYEFCVQVKDDLGNIENKVYKLNIINKSKGIESLYGAEAVVDNLRLPSGKERFNLK